MFNDLVNESESRWALLFDELELAPDFVLSELLTSLRSIDERVLLKLSLSPYSPGVEGFRTVFRALPRQDYNEICLWYAHKEESYDFGRAMMRAILAEEGIKVQKEEDVFGVSPFEETGNAYKPRSIQYETFQKSLQVDSVFREYFARQNLSLEDLPRLQDNQKAQVIRKIYPTLLFRQFFRVPEHELSSQRQKERSRKNPSIYGGTTGLLAMSEGNPRWIIGIVRGLLPIIREQGKASKRQQTAEVLRATHRFRALLNVIPANHPQNQKPARVLGILDKVGEFFHKAVVLEDFKPEPYGSFIVDSRFAEDMLNAFGIALNAGAIVYVPDPEADILLGSLRGKRFRLAYLLSPHYEVPIRLGTGISLGKILSPDNKSQQEFL